jgi:hypothetical protein
MLEKMIEAHQLIPYRVSSDDYILTEQLKTHFAQMKQERCPMYLTLDEFDRVIQWKLRGQYGRQRERRKANTDNGMACPGS